MSGERRILAGRYEVEALLGRGGFGRVWKVSDLSIPEQSWAVKEILAAGGTSASDAAFERETRILAALHHPALPRIVDRFTEGDAHYLVLEWVRGQDLQARVAARGPLPLSQVVAIARALADVLVYLHELPDPVVGPDLKASNVMLTDGGGIRLVDLGTSRRLGGTRRLDSAVLGSLGYAPPEQYGPSPRPGPASDLYSLGALLHFLASGRDPSVHPPFSFPLLRRLRAETPPTLEALVSKLVAYEPSARCATARDVLSALDGLGPLETGRLARLRRALAPAGARALLAASCMLAGLWALWPPSSPEPGPARAAAGPPPRPRAMRPAPQVLPPRSSYLVARGLEKQTPAEQVGTRVRVSLDAIRALAPTRLPRTWHCAVLDGERIWFGSEGGVVCWSTTQGRVSRSFDMQRITLQPLSHGVLHGGALFFTAGPEIVRLDRDALFVYTLSTTANSATLVKDGGGLRVLVGQRNFGRNRVPEAGYRWSAGGWLRERLPEAALAAADPRSSRPRFFWSPPGSTAVRAMFRDGYRDFSLPPEIGKPGRSRLSSMPDGSVVLWSVAHGVYRGRLARAGMTWERLVAAADLPDLLAPACSGHTHSLDSMVVGPAGQVALSNGTVHLLYDGREWRTIPQVKQMTSWQHPSELRLLAMDARGHVWASWDSGAELLEFDGRQWRLHGT